MSIIMGFAFNTAFRSSSPTPTPTINTPSASNSHLWGLFAPLPNRSVVSPSANTAPIKDMALSVFNPGTTALSVTSPSVSKALAVASSSKSVVEITSASTSYTKCLYCKSASDKPRTSPDLVILSESPTALSEVHMKSPISVVSRTEVSSSGDPKATTSNTKVISSVSDVLDATSKALENVGNDIADLAEAADEFMVSLRTQRDHIISQSKGKARALSEQIQNLNEEMIYRNERAKTRARELKKRGEELLWNTQEGLKKRTERARMRAKELGKSVLESDAWVTYQKVQEDMESRLSGGMRGNGDANGRQKKSKKEKENAKACLKEFRRLSRNQRVSRAEHCL